MPQQPDIRLIDVLRDVWQGRKAIFIGLICGLMIAGAYIALSLPHYKARMIVAPASPMNGAEMSSLMADDNLFALRFLIQRVGVSGSTDFLNFESIYAGPTVAQELLRDERVVAGLRNDRSFKFSLPKTEWNAAELSDYLRKRVKLSPLGAGGMREMIYYHQSPEFARYMLQQIQVISDQLIREDIRAQARERITYLNEAISRTLNPDHRRTLTTLLLEQERLLMLVSIDQPYAAKIIEPASATPRAAWPDTALVLCAVGLIGAFIGFVIFSFLHAPFVSTTATTAAGSGRGRRLNGCYNKMPSNNDAADTSRRAAE